MARKSRSARAGFRRSATVPASRIRSLARSIGRRFHPERIVLFGSYAYGTPTRDSDVDLLVIMRTRRDTADVAADIACASDTGISLDVLVRTPGELKWRLAEGECFLTEIMRMGQVLYEARHS